MAQKFLRYVGVLLVLGGIAGFFFPFKGLADLTTTHDLVHLVAGIVALAVSGKARPSLQVTWGLGVIFLAVGLVGLFTRSVLGLIILDPADTVVHFVVGAAALYVAISGRTSPQNQVRKAG